MPLQYKKNIKRIILFAIGLIFLLNINSIIKAETNYKEENIERNDYLQKNENIDEDTKKSILRRFREINQKEVLEDDLSIYTLSIFLSGDENSYYVHIDKQPYYYKVSVDSNKKDGNINIIDRYDYDEMKSISTPKSISSMKGDNGGTYYKTELKSGKTIYVYKDKKDIYSALTEKDYNKLLDSDETAKNGRYIELTEKDYKNLLNPEVKENNKEDRSTSIASVELNEGTLKNTNDSLKSDEKEDSVNLSAESVPNVNTVNPSSVSLPEYSELDAGHITFYQKVNNNAIDANLKSTIENGISNPNRGYEIYYLKDNVTQYLQDDVYVKNSDNNWYRFTPEVNINNGKKEVNYNITGVYTDSAMKSNMLETSSVKKIEGANGTYYKIDLKDGNGTFSGSIYTYKDKNGNYQKIDENDYNEILNSNTISELQNQSILGKEQADLSMDLSTGAVVRSGSDETDPIIHLDAGGQSSNYSSIKSIVNSIDAYCVDELEYSDKNPILSYYSDGNLTFNVKGYNSLKDKNKTKFFEFSFNIIDNFGLSNVQIRGKFKNFLKEQDPGLSKNIELLNSNVGEELSVAESWMKGPNKLVSKIIGILTVIIFIMLIFSLVVDLTYISLPVVRDVADVVGNGMDKLLHKKDTSYKKPFFISEEAYSSVADAETNTAKTSAILLYLRRRIVIIIIISTGTIFIATGTIYDFISFIIDIFLEVRG